MKRFSRGFTLVELLVVMAIIAILASLLLPALASRSWRRDRQTSTPGSTPVDLALVEFIRAATRRL